MLGIDICVEMKCLLLTVDNHCIINRLFNDYDLIVVKLGEICKIFFINMKSQMAYVMAEHVC